MAEQETCIDETQNVNEVDNLNKKIKWAGIVSNRRFLVSLPPSLNIEDWWVSDCSLGDLNAESPELYIEYYLVHLNLKHFLALRDIKFDAKVEFLDPTGVVTDTLLYTNCTIKNIHTMSLSYDVPEDADDSKMRISLKLESEKVEAL